MEEVHAFDNVAKQLARRGETHAVNESAAKKPLAPEPTAASVFLSPHLDHALGRIGMPFDERSVRGALNYYSLLHDHLFVIDSQFLNNRLLRDLFLSGQATDRGYRRLVSDEIAVPVLRDSAASFRDLDRQMREAQTAGLLAEHDVEEYMEWLDREGVARHRYSLSSMADRYTTMVETSLVDQELMRTFRLDGVVSRLNQYLDERRN